MAPPAGLNKPTRRGSRGGINKRLNPRRRVVQAEKKVAATPAERQERSDFWRVAVADHVLNGKDKVLCFYGGATSWPFSNHSKSPFRCDPHGTVSCSEQPYLIEQARHFGATDTAEAIRRTTNPGTMKTLIKADKILQAQKVPGHPKYEEWLKIREGIMSRIVLQKFTNDAKARRALLATGNTFLIEASPHDTFWGSGVSRYVSNAKLGPELPTFGYNRLGNILMQVRRRLREAEKGRGGRLNAAAPGPSHSH